ncbi:MAG: hypothetical protein WAT39_09775 [Planctomycetota bacterium]
MLRPLVLAVLFAFPLAAQTITLAEGAPSALTIVALPEANPTAPDTVVLQGVEFLPIEISGRTLAQELDSSRSRRVARFGITRVELPDGGRLFRYRRGGGQAWGFLHVAAHGAPVVLIELPGTGSALADPFADRIAVAANGQHAAFALVAGGLFVARLDGGTFASTGTAVRQVVGPASAVVPTSVLVGSSVVWYQHDGIQNANPVYRCDLADGSVPVDVSPAPQANAITKDQMAIARDGSRLVFLYGPVLQQRLWQCGLTGGSTVLPPPPNKYEEPGYLPEDPGEPAMLVNDAGTRLFCIEANVRDELMLLDLGGVLPALAITESTIFQPYIGSHILPRFTGDRLLVAIGDPAQMDWFRAELATAGGTVANLTGTGSLLQPFPAGTIDPRQATDAGGRLLVAEQQGASLALRAIDAATGAQAIVQQDLLGPPEVGSTVAGAPDVLVRSSTGERLYWGTSGALYGALPVGLTLTPPAQGPLYAATWVALANQWGCAAFWLPNGSFVTGPLEFDLKQLCLTPAGGVVANGNPLRYLAPGVFTVLPRPAVPLRLCLSGAGG